MKIPANGNRPSWGEIGGAAWRAAKAWGDLAAGVIYMIATMTAVLNVCWLLITGEALAPMFENKLLSGLAFVAAFAFAFLGWTSRSIEQAPRLIEQMRDLERSRPRA